MSSIDEYSELIELNQKVIGYGLIISFILLIGLAVLLYDFYYA